jgi:aspartyl-tRNA synthetase
MQRFERTVFCGMVNESFLDKEITLAGWVNKRRDLGKLIFIDLRDRSGLMQLVFNPEISSQAYDSASSLRSEYVISVKGIVAHRAPGMANTGMATGQYELHVHELTILNRSKTLPFNLDDLAHVDEELRFKYRYLDLRDPVHQSRFALRNKVTFLMREFLQTKGFYEIETPILTKNTPEGAREFIVPSRNHKTHFYALPQSPQLYKQLLMASGMERYFQVARCFRDEDLRADRQPEFTQLDIEMSFVKEGDVQDLIEQLLKHIWKKIFDIDLATPFPRMSYDDAFNFYGSDKPDLRFALKIGDCSSLFQETPVKFLKSVLDNNGKIGAICIPDHGFSRSELDIWSERATKLGAKGLVWIRFSEDGKPESSIAKFLPESFLKDCRRTFPEITAKSTLFIMAGPYKQTWTALGRLRLEIAQALGMIPANQYHFSWVVDFPLLEYNEETKSFDATHHPFTSPQEGWENLPPEQIKACAYDVVLNGIELGGGSIRIHDAAVQDKVFDLIGLSKEQAKAKFGFLLEAQEYGFPPHGGIALGLDRFIMLMCGAQSIRDVIAFPKTTSGYDPLMDSPVTVPDEQLKDYGLCLLPKTQK